MSKFSMKMGGKEVGPAAVYAPPHDMKGRAGVSMMQPPGAEEVGQQRVSVGGISTRSAAGTKTSGIQARGVGAATKGKMARGPMG